MARKRCSLARVATVSKASPVRSSIMARKGDLEKFLAATSNKDGSFSHVNNFPEGGRALNDEIVILKRE